MITWKVTGRPFSLNAVLRDLSLCLPCLLPCKPELAVQSEEMLLAVLPLGLLSIEPVSTTTCNHGRMSKSVYVECRSLPQLVTSRHACRSICLLSRCAGAILCTGCWSCHGAPLCAERRKTVSLAPRPLSPLSLRLGEKQT